MLTVLVPNLNSGDLWKRTLSGISRVADKIDKVIILDGFSSDNSAEFFKDGLLKIGVQTDVKKYPPSGIIDAIRSGVNLVETSHVLINLCGDELLSLPLIASCKDNSILFGACEILDDKNIKIGEFLEKNISSVTYRMVHINMNSVIWPTYFLKKSKSLYLDYKIASDHALFLEAYCTKKMLIYSPEIKSIFYKDGISSQSNMYAFGLGEGFYLTLHYGNIFGSLIYYFYCLIFRKVDFKSFLKGFIYARNLNK